ncbi:hypothetical protein ACFV5N_09195 [Streptomyces sp. NPDC059853]|uniref:hypothetical protein n=1 Tax=Streptomyces sp. NPDC059853 TaxID=3346973 RepID=UPI003665D059
MSVQPEGYRDPHAYEASDPETALKYAIQHIRGDRTEVIEGAIEPVSPSWDQENAADLIRDQLVPALRRRYAEYRAPLYLLVDRQERSCSLFSHPGELGYSRVDGPHPFGTPIELPEPFGITLDTKELG